MLVCMVCTSMTMSLKSSSDALMPVTTQMDDDVPEEQLRHSGARVHGRCNYDDFPEEQLRPSNALKYADDQDVPKEQLRHSGARVHGRYTYDDVPEELPRDSNTRLQAKYAPDVPEEVPRYSRGTRFDPETGAPIEQPKFDPYTGAPIQSIPPVQPKFDTNTGRAPIQVRPEKNTGEPIQCSAGAQSCDPVKVKKEANLSMNLGIIGFIVLGYILGPFAIKYGLSAKKAIENHPEAAIQRRSLTSGKRRFHSWMY